MGRDHRLYETAQALKDLNKESVVHRLNKESLDEVAQLNRKRKELYAMKENARRRKENFSSYYEFALTENLSTALKAIYMSALKETMMFTNTTRLMGEKLVDNYIEEQGGAYEILRRMDKKTYLLDTVKRIVEDATEDCVDLYKNSTMDAVAAEKDTADEAEREEEYISSNCSRRGRIVAAITDLFHTKGISFRFDPYTEEGFLKCVGNTLKFILADSEQTRYAFESLIDANLSPDINVDLDDAGELYLTVSKVKPYNEADEEDKPEKKEDKKSKKDDDDDADLNIDTPDMPNMDDEDDDDKDDKKKSKKDDEDDSKDDKDDKDDDKDKDDKDDDKKKSKKSTKKDDKDDDKDIDNVDDLEAKDVSDKDPEIPQDSKEDMYNKLENEEDIGNAVNLIAQRISSAEEEFIKKNAEDKEKIEELVNRINERIAAAKKSPNVSEEEEKEIEQECAMDYRRGISNIRNNRAHGIFEMVVRNLSNSAALTESASVKREYFNEAGNLNMSNIVDASKVMYGFLEFVNTLQLERVDENYVKRVLTEM